MEDAEIMKMHHAFVEADAKYNAQIEINVALRSENAHLREIIDKLLLYGIQRNPKSISE